MTSAEIAALVATLAFGFVEALGGFYPARRTWMRLRQARGRRAVRAMRERFEAAAQHRAPRTLSTLLLSLVLIWIAAASLLDKRWYEVVLDVLPYGIVLAALLRTPSALRRVAARMKEHEREVGDDPDAEPDDGPSAFAL
jgi:hypothetical protein